MNMAKHRPDGCACVGDGAGLGDMLVDGVTNMAAEAHPLSRRASPSRERRTLVNVPVCGLSRRTGMSPNKEVRGD